VKYKYKRRPYRHQVAALKDLLSRDFGGALLMEPRTGKTQVAIDFCGVRHMQGVVNRVVIVCPVSVIGVWIDEIQAVCPWPHRITIWDKQGRKEVDLPRNNRSVLDFVIINYEAFQQPGRILGRNEDGEIRRSKTRGGRFEMKRALIRWQPQCIILDESHRIKTPSARKTTTLWSIGRVADYRIIATGTAVTKAKRIFDIYSQWKFLNPNGWVQDYTIASFKGEFGIWRSMGKYDRWIRNQNMPKLRGLIHQDAFAITRDECYDLPKAFPPRLIKVPLEESASAYDQMAEDLIARIKTGEVTVAQIKIVQRTRFAQITSGIARTEPTPAYPSGRLVRIGREKLRVLEDLLVDMFEEDEKVVIAARFRADIASIVKVVQKLKGRAFELHGGVTRAQRDINIRNFRTHNGPGAFIMQPSAGALGIDLSTSSTMIWYSLTDSYVDWTQCTDRVALAERAVRTIYLLGEGTNDEIMYEALQTDQDVGKMIQESPNRLRRNLKRAA
jgi:SNF2 family DNA or RNA helicase